MEEGNKKYSVNEELRYTNRNCVVIKEVRELAKEMLYVDEYDGGALERLQNKVNVLEEAVYRMLIIMMQDPKVASAITEMELYEVKEEGK